MPQPTKRKVNSAKGTGNKPKKATKKNTADPRLPSKPPKPRKRKVHKQEYGTSKLEERFAKDFLDKLGVKYEYQFKASSIGRFFDFYIPECHILIEVDGDYYHGRGLVYEDKNPMQKKNARVDDIKDHWALLNGIPLIRIWEHDINKNPSKVMNTLREAFGKAEEQKKINDEKKKRH